MIAGKYRVEAVVGTGGMGVVLSALHLQLGQSVAIKVLTMSTISEARRHEAQTRFLREAQAAAGLTSDHVVRVFDVGTLESGVPYMVMELLSGDDLSAIIDREGPISVEQAVEYVAQACDAIAEAHSRGVAHRDLKPANLFVARKKDGRTTVKVLDFGISKAVVGGEDPIDGGLTATRTVVGSPYYMSPEQVRDAKRVDTRTDIWSLGMILYELLIGMPAFDAETLPGICAAIVADPPPPIRMARRDVPIELEGIILRCLEKLPDQRFQTVEELLQALLPFRSASALSAAAVSGAGTGNFKAVSGAGMRVSGDDPASASFPREATPRSGLAERPDGARPTATRVTGRLIAAMIFGLLLAGATYSYFATRAPSATAGPAASPARPPSFSLSIKSTPSGAQVVEGDRVLGSTPLSLDIDAASVARAPRELWLKLDGHVSYRVVQGPSDHDVHLVAMLSPLLPPPSPVERAAAPATAAPNQKAEPPRPPTRRRAGHRATAVKTQKPEPAAAPSDIRLER